MSQAIGATSTTRRLRLGAKRAALEAEAEFVDQLKQMEIKEVRSRHQREVLEKKSTLSQFTCRGRDPSKGGSH